MTFLIKYRVVSSLCLSLLLYGCTKDNKEQVPLSTLSTENLYLSTFENPNQGQKLGGLLVVSNQSPLMYSLGFESPEGALGINSSNGILSVLDSNYFDFESRTLITAVVSVKSNSLMDSSIVYIELSDIDESVVTVESTNCENKVDTIFFNYHSRVNGKSCYFNSSPFGGYISYENFRWIVDGEPANRSSGSPLFINNDWSANTIPPRSPWKVMSSYCNPAGTFIIININ